MKTLLALIGLGLPVLAQNPILPPANIPITELAAVTPPPPANSLVSTYREKAPGRTLYAWSAVSLIAANVADVASSWKQQEANPVIAGSGGQFSASSVALKSGFVGGAIVLEYIVLRHRPDMYKRLAWLNFGASGALAGVAAHNMALR